MNLPPLPLANGSLYVDNSMIELLTTCPRALEYNRFHKRVAAVSKPSLAFGSAIHLALEHRYKAYKNMAPDAILADEQSQLLSKFFEENPGDPEDYRNLNWACEIIRRYNDRYATEEFQLLTDENGEVQVEMSFALPLFNMEVWLPDKALRGLSVLIIPDEVRIGYIKASIPVIYTGRIDLPVMWDDQLFIIDHKTTSILGPQFGDKMKMSAQQKGYCWAFEQLTKKKVAGYCINAIRVKEPPAYLTNPDSPRKGKNTVDSWWQESFVRERYFLQAGEMEEWKRNVIALIEEMFWHYSNDYMPMKTAWCNQFGRCAYFDVCSLSGSDRGVMLSSGMFTENTWNPLKTPTTSKQ